MPLPMLISPDVDARLQRAVLRLPEPSQEALLNYLRYGIPPGSFLQAVLANDLAQACARADDTNRRAFFDYVAVLYSHAPLEAWGSRVKVQQWITAGMDARRDHLVLED